MILFVTRSVWCGLRDHVNFIYLEQTEQELWTDLKVLRLIKQNISDLRGGAVIRGYIRNLVFRKLARKLKTSSMLKVLKHSAPIERRWPETFTLTPASEYLKIWSLSPYKTELVNYWKLESEASDNLIEVSKFTFRPQTKWLYLTNHDHNLSAVFRSSIGALIDRTYSMIGHTWTGRWNLLGLAYTTSPLEFRWTQDESWMTPMWPDLCGAPNSGVHFTNKYLTSSSYLLIKTIYRVFFFDVRLY